MNLDLDGVAVAFAALGEPGGKAFGEALGSEAKTCFEAAIGDGESVVKVGGVGEVAHGELVQPLYRAGATLAVDDDVDLEFLGVHEAMIAVARYR